MNNIIVLQVFCKYLLCKLRPIVTCNGIWQTMSREDLFQTFDDFLCCFCSSYLNLIISAIIVNHNKNVLSGWQWTQVIDCQILPNTIPQFFPRHRFQWHPHQLASMTSATLSFTVLVYSRPPGVLQATSCPRHRFRFQWHPHQLASMTSATLSFTVLVYSRPPYFAA